MKKLLFVCIMMITALSYSQSIDTNLNQSKDQLKAIKDDRIKVTFDLLINNQHVDSNYVVYFKKGNQNSVYKLEVPRKQEGQFTAYLCYNQSYTITFECNGYISKIMEISTYNAPKYDWQANISIIMPRGKREAIYCGGIAYNPYLGEFVKTRKVRQ